MFKITCLNCREEVVLTQYNGFDVEYAGDNISFINNKGDCVFRFKCNKCGNKLKAIAISLLVKRENGSLPMKE